MPRVNCISHLPTKRGTADCVLWASKSQQSRGPSTWLSRTLVKYLTFGKLLLDLIFNTEIIMGIPWSILLLSTAIVVVWSWVNGIYQPIHSPKEPPVVAASIPYIGHILGLLRHGTRYYQMIRYYAVNLTSSVFHGADFCFFGVSAKCRLPIYTLKMLNGKVYIVTDPNLITAVNRNSKALAFNPFIAQVGMRITGHGEATSKIVQHNLNGENGSGYVIDVHDGTVAALAPGK